MRTIPRMLTGLVIPIVCLASTAALAQSRTTYDFRSREDVAKIRTFGFKDTAPSDRVSAKTTTYDSPFIRERTHAAVAAQLESRGLKRDDKNPDVFVTTTRIFKTDYTTLGSYGWGYPYGGWGYGYGAGYRYTAGYPYGWGYGGWSPSYVVEEITGTLAVDLEDAETGQLVWRGVGMKHVHQTSKPTSRVRRVNEEVADIFKNFPPPTGH